jgi:hypothetical protein
MNDFFDDFYRISKKAEERRSILKKMSTKYGKTKTVNKLNKESKTRSDSSYKKMQSDIEWLKGDSKKLYKPFPSSAKNKKYSVYVKKDGKTKLIHFGDSRYEQYKDILGHYSKLDHGDKDRRKNYYSRHGKTSDKSSAKYWSHKILWPLR